MGRYALLIAAGDYDDPALSQLRAPQQDVDGLAVLLEDPAIGNFTVRTLHDAPDYEVRQEIENLLAERTSDDLVLLYFSCHGLVDVAHRLHFAAPNTQTKRPASTAISRSFVNEQLEGCRAAAKVLVLDCCFAGAYSEGFKSGAVAALDGQLGSGYVVLSACDTYEYAFESSNLVETSPRGSIFTEVLIDGLRTGAADLDGNGKISVDELFKFVHDGVVRRRPDQTPKWSAHNAEPHIYLASTPSVAAGGTAPSVAAGGTAVGRAAVAGAPTGGAPTAPRPSTHNRHQVIVGRGFRSASDLVRRALGPMGRRVLVSDGAGGYREVADAASIVAHYQPGDASEAVGAGYVKEIVEHVRARVGDGAASGVVLAQAMLERATAALRAGAHPVALRRGVDAAIEAVSQALRERAQPVRTKEQIAAVSGQAGRDPYIGEVIAEAVDKVGQDGVILVEEGNTFGTGLELFEGMRFDRGYLSPGFVTERERAQAVLHDPYILLVGDRIAAVSDILAMLERLMQATPSRPLLLVADDVEGEALATLVVNKTRGTFASVAVKAPGFGDRRKAIMQDLATLTGGRVIASRSEIAATQLTSLGRARKVIADEDETTIIEGSGDATTIKARIKAIRTEIERTDSDYDREKMQERLAKLAGGVAVIKVGGRTETAVAEHARRAEAAVRTAYAAVSGGVLAGGGAALARVGAALAGGGSGSPDERLGFRLVVESLDAPLREIVGNAGYEVEPTIAELLRRGDRYAFDARTGDFVDAFPDTLIAPAAACIAAFESAAASTSRYIMIA